SAFAEGKISCLSSFWWRNKYSIIIFYHAIALIDGFLYLSVKKSSRLGKSSVFLSVKFANFWLI
ncbi:MAG: hypothetical protein V3R78_03035, partial [Thermodesulfobacteriota bacterium]